MDEMERTKEQFVKEEIELTRRNWEPAAKVTTVVRVCSRDGGRMDL